MVCPPTTVYSAVNVITAPKEVLISEETEHYAYPEQRAESWRWVKNLLSRGK